MKKVVFYTGFISMYNQPVEQYHAQTGGFFIELGVNIKRFLDLYGQLDTVKLKVCTTEPLWKEFLEKYPFAVHKSVEFLDYAKVLEKQKLTENIYWYDALRFQIFKTIEEEEDTLVYWIDLDAVILREDLLELCLENSDSIISPLDCYPLWNDPKWKKDLDEYSFIFKKFSLKVKPEPLKYSNTGTFFGGPFKSVKFISSKVLEVERRIRRPVQPSAAVLEYISCYVFQEFCEMYNIKRKSLDLNRYVWHYTGQRIPTTSYVDVLWVHFPKDIYLFREFCDKRTEEFRIEYIKKVFLEILKTDTKGQDKKLWKDMVIDTYKEFKARKKESKKGSLV